MSLSAVNSQFSLCVESEFFYNYFNILTRTLANARRGYSKFCPWVQ